MKNRKVHNSDMLIPGCLGRMVNLFDINPAMTGIKLLMDKTHYDGSSLYGKSGVARSLTRIGCPLEDKWVESELRSKASNRTTMKLLIDHEMSKELEPKHIPPNVVAKLMGLDALLRNQKDSGAHYSRSIIHERNDSMHSEKTLEFGQTDSSVSDEQSKPEANYLEQKKMALVRQKFVEAKRLVTDDKSRQTKEFQDALEFLSSNQDLLVKCLQEPNAPLTQHFYQMNAVPVSAESKRITVLKPCKMKGDGKVSVSGKKNEKHAEKSAPVALAHGRSKSNDERSSTFSYWYADDPLPTRIVVLKPSIGNACEIGTPASPDSSSLKTTEGEDYFTETEVCDALESREVAKEITRQMRKKLVGGRSDETMHSSVFSNGYTGDESSNSKSDNEYDDETNSEVMSPTSRHSWDYINRFSSPFSSSSRSHASCSPESSVCREAKKRLSERWAMVALHGNPSEQRHIRSSSTLGEMLALSDTKNNIISEMVGNEVKARATTSCISHDSTTDESMLDSQSSFLRSKSVPVSSSMYGSRLNVELSGPKVGKPDESEEDSKSKNTKTSFKWKVSSLFFKKNKKVNKGAANAPGTEHLPPHMSTLESSELYTVKSLGNTLKLVGRKASEESTHRGLQGQNADTPSSRAVSSVWRLAKSDDNHEQPSPISVLEMLFGEDDDITALDFANNNSKHEQGAEAHCRQLKSSLIDKSPPIGSVSRTISSKNLCSSTSTIFPTTHLVAPLGPETEEDWYLFVRTLLADTGINDECQSDTFFTRWHSPDSPIDPMLREKYINLTNKPLAYEANRRQWRSSRKLMYDCVNAALIDITQYRVPETKHRLQASTSVSSEGHNLVPLTDEVWTKIKEWLANDARWIVGDDGDSNNSLLVEMVVKHGVVGKEWAENMRVEIDEVGKEIEEKLLEELVEDAVAALTGRDP